MKSILILAMLVAMTASAQELREEFLVVNYGVHSVVALGNVIYVAGSFDFVGPSTGGFAALDNTTGAVVAPYPQITGDVNAIVPDGSGGWFIGGDFTSVMGQPRNGLAHIEATGTLTSWNPGDPGTLVNALAVDAGKVYLGGWFTSVGAQPRENLAAVDATTGVVTPWNPGASGSVNSLAASGGAVYAGGSFWTIGGESRLGIAALDAATGDVIGAWNANLAHQPYQGLAVDDIEVWSATGTVYIGGIFGVSGGMRWNLAALDAATGTDTGWSPNPNGAVRDIALYTTGSPATLTHVIVGGDFSTIGYFTSSAPYLAMVDTSPFAFAFGYGADGSVNTVTISGQTLYAGGMFQRIGGAARKNIAALDITNSQATAWSPQSGFPISAIGVGAGKVFAGGQYGQFGGSIGGQPRKRLIALDAVTGELLDWNPNPDNYVYTLATDGNLIYAGGLFTSIGGQWRNRIAALDPTTGGATSWDPNANAVVLDLLLSGTSIYALGEFSNIGNAYHYRVAEIDLATGVPTSWSPNPQLGPVTCIAVGNGVVYLGGYFTSLGGAPRHYLGAVDPTSGVATEWDPNPNYSPAALATDGSRVYVGGNFTSIAGQPRNYLAAFENENLLGWDLGVDGDISDLELVGNVLYAGGSFNSVGGLPHRGIFGINATTGAVMDWNADTRYQVYMLSSSAGTLFAGGNIRSVGGAPRSGLAVFSNVPTDVGPSSATPRMSLRAAPNPFSGDVSLAFHLPVASKVDVDVYDVTGRLVRRLHPGGLVVGEMRLWWDGRNDAGVQVSAGTYFARVVAGAHRSTAKLLLIR